MTEAADIRVVHGLRERWRHSVAHQQPRTRVVEITRVVVLVRFGQGGAESLLVYSEILGDSTSRKARDAVATEDSDPHTPGPEGVSRSRLRLLRFRTW